jgi:hypothetical protein
MSKKWMVGFDPADCKYHPIYSEPMYKDAITFETIDECRAHCRQMNIDSDKAWEKVKNKL